MAPLFLSFLLFLGIPRMTSQSYFFTRFSHYFIGHLVFFVCLSLSGCGFRPMHTNSVKPSIQESAVYQSIKIDIVPNREGQILRNELIDRLYIYNSVTNPQYTLTIDPIKESPRDIAITKSSEATRAQLWMTSAMHLKNVAGEEILSRDLRSIASYNTLESEFATRVTEKAARESALVDLARQIELQLNLYFNHQTQ